MFKKLRSSLLFYSISTTLVALIIVVSISYSTFRNLMEHNISETVYNKLQIVADNIDLNLELVDSMIEWFALNGEIIAFINTSDDYPDSLKFKSIAAYNIIRNSIYTNGLHPYINKVLIGSSRGNFIETGLINGNGSDYNIAIENLTGAEGSLIMEPFKFSEEELIYPIHKIITGFTNSGSLGHIFVTLNFKIFTKYMDMEKKDKSTIFYIGLGRGIYRVFNNEVTPALELDENFILDFLRTERNFFLRDGVDIPEVDVVINGQERNLIVYKGSTKDFFLAQVAPDIQLDRQGWIFVRLLLLVIFVVSFLAFAIVLTIDKTINIPILHIGQRIQEISKGDFSTDLSIEYSNEIGIIGCGINLMVARIEQLISKRVQDEKIKKDLEFRVLQSQINPHFLYNTLNSIKWMAIAQKTTGIPEMVNSLAVLLKHISKGTGQMITLKEELFLLKKYCIIQSFRSGGIVDTNVIFESPDLEKCQIIKFTLQPLVENAIFHGIEPKQIKGEININIKRSSFGDVIIEVRDNGQGIPEDILSGIFEDNNNNSQSFNHIGLKNVNERLKLYFGEKYGLSVDSVLGEYTVIRILIPFTGGSECINC